MIRRSAANEWRRKKEKKLREEKKKYEMQVKAEKSENARFKRQRKELQERGGMCFVRDKNVSMPNLRK